MRISPLVFCTDKNYKNIQRIVEIDTGISNPNTSSYCCNFVYLYILRHLVDKDFDKRDLNRIINDSIERACQLYPGEVEKIKSLIGDVPDVKGWDKGWVRHAVNIAIKCLMNIDKKNYRQLIKETICRGGDTDTTAAICGCLTGAYFGHDEMLKDDITKKNIDLVKNCDTKNGDYKRDDFMSFNSIKDLF